MEIKMDLHDDELRRFEAEGGAPLPVSDDQGYIEHEGARIWYSRYGAGPLWFCCMVVSVIVAIGSQVPALVGSGYQTVLIDSLGHGRSTRDAQPFSYELMASDVLAVMDEIAY
jgi:pimeloyl-ACP methyl ester carboxylesterase